MNIQKAIRNRLKSLEEIDDITITETKTQIDIVHRLHHVADFSFRWIDDNHYVGYFVDPNGQTSQAIVSIWTKLDAIKFCSLYINLVELRAMR